jgi:hypothetical protein
VLRRMPKGQRRVRRPGRRPRGAGSGDEYPKAGGGMQAKSMMRQPLPSLRRERKPARIRSAFTAISVIVACEVRLEALYLRSTPPGVGSRLTGWARVPVTRHWH